MIRNHETGLTNGELAELSEKIAAGHISRSCRKARKDWFNIRLATGRRAVGAYAWDSEGFERLAVR